MKPTELPMQQQMPEPDAPEQRPNWFQRLGWLALIWACSVAALFVVAFIFRTAMGWAGLTLPTG